MKLRVRTSTGVSNLEVDPHITFAQLKAQLQAQARKSTPHQCPFSISDTPPSFSALVRIGFPPKPLQAPDTDLISSILSNGDMILVQSTTNPTSKPTNIPKRSPQGIAPPPPSSILSNGSLTIRVVPDDNSCLFRSVNGILGHPTNSVTQLRTIVRNAVAADSALYSEAFLGKSNLAYQQWIMSDNAWGGAIELSILSQHFKIEFAAFDVKNMRLDRYGEGNSYETVGYLVYDGIHYNYVALAIGAAHGFSQDVTQFDINDRLVAQHVRDLIQKENDAKRFTDTATFVLNCGQCGAKLRGETQALEHAKSTGHTQFSEN